MLKGTRKFQTIMNNYRKYQYEKSKIPGYNFKNKTSLNNRFIEELNRVKRHQNFSDLEYMINEIKIENKKQKSNKVFEVTGKENNFERGRFVKNEKITKEAFFFYRNKLENNSDLSNHDKSNLKSNDLKLFDSPPSHIQQTSSLRELDCSSSTNHSAKKKFLALPILLNKTNLNLSPLTDSMRSDDDRKISFNNNNDDNDKKLTLSKKMTITDSEISNKCKKFTISKKILSVDKKLSNHLSNTNTGLYAKINIYNNTISDEMRDMRYTKKNNGINLFLKYAKKNNISNKLNTKYKKPMNIRDKQKTDLFRFRLPFLRHEILNQINEVTETSENLEKHISHYSFGSDIIFRKEKNKFKVINDSIA